MARRAVRFWQVVRRVAKWSFHIVALFGLVLIVMDLCCKERREALLQVILGPVSAVYLNLTADPLPESIESNLSIFEWYLKPKKCEAKSHSHINVLYFGDTCGKNSVALWGEALFFDDKESFERVRKNAFCRCRAKIPLDQGGGKKGLVCFDDLDRFKVYLFFEDELKSVVMELCDKEQIKHLFELAKGVRKKERGEEEKDKR